MDNNVGIFLGRFCPLHLGHMKIIQKMIDNHGLDNCMVLIGSCNSFSISVPFSYSDRRRWILRLFKGLKVIGIPDVSSDNEWLTLLDDYIRVGFGKEVEPVFYGGSIKDVEFYYTHGNKKVEIVDRHELELSATNVRRLMLLGEKIDSVVDPRIAKEVVEIFNGSVKKLERV